MFKIVSKFLAGGLALSAASVVSAQACDLTLESAGQVRFEDYSSTDREVRPQKITLRLRNDSDDACVGAMNIEAVDGNGYLVGLSGERMRYGLFSGRDSSQIVFQSGSQSQNQLPISLPADSSRTLDMYLVVDRFQNLPAGSYMTDLNLTLQNQDLRNLDSMTIRVGANVKPSLQANFTGIGGIVSSKSALTSKSSRQKAVLNLGELTPNETRRLGLQIRANSPVTIQVSSENSGALQHEHGEGEIAYGVRLNEQYLDLSSSSILRGYSSPKKNGRTNPLVVKLSDFGNNVPAGKYADTLTFRISAR